MSYENFIANRERRALAKAQAEYDNRLPPEDDFGELECQRCHEMFETENPDAKLCDKCRRQEDDL